MASNVSRMQRGGSTTADRLASRAERPGRGLSRQAMPGGGEVFSGDLASRALKTLGARAMTVDNSIIVSDEFDPGRPEDQALFAHEQFHQENSGGAGTHEHRDGEEIAARAVERMVLHRARAGGAESHEANLAVPSTGAVGKEGSGSQMRENQEADSAAQSGYEALVRLGMDHLLVVDRLAQEVIQGLDHARDGQLERFADKKGFL
jgi:hypothetical protein